MTAPVFELGINLGLPEEIYFGHPALSASSAKALLNDTPAVYKWRRENPVTKAAYDLGHYVHGELLGSGSPVEVLDFPDWRTAKSQAAKKAAYAAGHVPMLAKEADEGDLMVASVREYLASAGMGTVFAPGHGQGEVSLLWEDEARGVQRRARLDWLHETIPGQPLTIVDLKTGQSANPLDLGRIAYNFGYHQQAAWYIDGLAAVTGTPVEDIVFVHVTVEKEAPYLPSVTQLDQEALDVGRELNDRAITLWKACMADDTWPGYAPTIQTVSLPRWAARELDD